MSYKKAEVKTEVMSDKKKGRQESGVRRQKKKALTRC